MKTCPRCDEICSNRSNFCSNCGYAFPDGCGVPQQLADPLIVPVVVQMKEPDPVANESSEKVPVPENSFKLQEESVLNSASDSEAEQTPEPEVYIELVRIADDEALISPSEIYIDNDYVGILEYNSRKKYPVSFGKHIVVIETGEQRRTRQFENSRNEPVQVYRFTVRPQNPNQKSSGSPKKKHTVAKIFGTLLVLGAACAMFLPKETAAKVVPDGIRERVSSLVDRLIPPDQDKIPGDTLEEFSEQDEASGPESAGDPASEANDPVNQPVSPEADSDSSPNADGYRAIYEEYAGKLRAATPGLIDEFNAEASSNKDGINGLAEINNAKIAKLSELSNEGIDQMADYMWIHGSGDYTEYSAWADKLYAVYNEEAQKITDVYMAAGTGRLG